MTKAFMDRMKEPASGVSDPSVTSSGSDFEAFFEAEHERLLRALFVVTGSAEEADELMQDAFVAVWERWDRVGGMRDPTGYLYRTAMNRFRSRLRSARVAARRIVRADPRPDLFEAVDDRDLVVRALRPLRAPASRPRPHGPARLRLGEGGHDPGRQALHRSSPRVSGTGGAAEERGAVGCVTWGTCSSGSATGSPRHRMRWSAWRGARRAGSGTAASPRRSSRSPCRSRASPAWSPPSAACVEPRPDRTASPGSAWTARRSRSRPTNWRRGSSWDLGDPERPVEDRCRDQRGTPAPEHDRRRVARGGGGVRMGHRVPRSRGERLPGVDGGVEARLDDGRDARDD